MLRIGGIAILGLMFLVGCGGSTPPSQPTGVTVSPASATVIAGGVNQFTAIVTPSGASQAVTWSVQEGAAGGAITSAGLYTAPNAAGTFHVVATSQADNTKSATALVNVPPVPSISSLSPSSASAGAADFTLTVNGSNFASDAVVRWNGSSRTTTFVSSTQLTAAILASDVGTAGTAQVTVVNPASGSGISSNALAFSIVNPTPALSSLSPASIMAGAAPFILTVNGSGFVRGATAQWNGNNRTTTFVSSTQLTAAIPIRDVAAEGTAQVSVFNPAPGGGSSSALLFTIDPLTNNPTPSITSLSDMSAPAGWPGFPLTVNGSGFVAASVGQFNGLNRATTVLSSSLVKAAIPAGDLTIAGNARVTVFNSSPGGGLSNAITLTIKSVLAGAVGTIERSSLASDLTEADKGSRGASISADGRFVVFSSDATNLVPGDTNGFTDVFLRDTCINAPAGCVPSTVRVSVASDGTESNGFSGEASISANGRFVAFVSDATNLVTGDTNHFPDVFVRDTCFGAPASCTPSTTRVSLNNDGSQILLENHEPTLSGDGRFVAFASGISGYYYYSNDNFDVLVRDTCVGAPSACKPSTTHVAVANDGTPGNDSSDLPVISANGRFVTFRSFATNLVAGDTNKAADVFVHDTCFGAPTGCTPSTVRVSVASDGTEADRDSSSPAISADGRFIVFTSLATNLVTGDTNSSQDVFVRDTCLGAASSCKPSTFRVSVSSDGTQADSNSDSPAISADGRFVAFSSSATNLVANDTNKLPDVFVRDTCIGAPAGCTPGTVRVSLAQDGTQANGDSIRPAINGNGRFVAFESTASNLAPGDTNAATDIFCCSHRVQSQHCDFKPHIVGCGEKVGAHSREEAERGGFCRSAFREFATKRPKKLPVQVDRAVSRADRAGEKQGGIRSC